jgi:hypothetical protein
MTDRRAGPRQGPYVAKLPRARNDDGAWRRKRSDAGKPRRPRRDDAGFGGLLSRLLKK